MINVLCLTVYLLNAFHSTVITQAMCKPLSCRHGIPDKTNSALPEELV
jgi:hypothetical protein